MRAGFQGESGAFSEEAVRALLGDVEMHGYHTFAAVIDALKDGTISHAVLPYENSLHGPIAAVHDLVAGDASLIVDREVALPIEQCLIVMPSVTIEHIDTVASHPVALAQCSRFLEQHPAWRAVETHDTAGAVREMMERGRPATAAIGPARAAKRYSACLLLRGIQDDVENITRFWLIKTST